MHLSFNHSSNHSSSVSSESTFLFKDGFLPSLTNEQNKISLIVFAVFGLLAACYVINRINFKAKLLNEENKEAPLGENEASPLNEKKKTGFGNILSILPMMAR